MSRLDVENLPLLVPAFRAITFPAKQLPTDFFPAVVDRVVDGDSAWLFIDLRFDGITAHRNCRFLGIQAPDKQPAKGECTEFVRGFMPSSKHIVVYVPGIDKYGRPLVAIFLPELDVSLNEHMITTGRAVPYDGQSPKPDTASEKGTKDV